MTATNRQRIAELIHWTIRLWSLPLVAVTLLLSTDAATAQPGSVASPANVTVSPAEVTAFMQTFQQDPNELLKLETNPKRVPLLLEAIKRDPAGPWVTYLHGFCFHADRAAIWRQPPATRAAVYARIIQYLSTAQIATTKALKADPQNLRVKNNVAMLNEAIAQAYAEADTRTNQTRSITGPRPATNAVMRPAPGAANATGARNSRAQACASQLKQIDLAKQMWKDDNNKADSATPTVADLTTYLPYHKYPTCPDGGTYTIGRLNEKPRCSIPGHVLPSSAK
jgi:hypothetical protein